MSTTSKRQSRGIKKKYPDVAVLRRPSNRPFATFGAHDPEGNYFDLTQEGMDNRETSMRFGLAHRRSNRNGNSQDASITSNCGR